MLLFLTQWWTWISNPWVQHCNETLSVSTSPSAQGLLAFWMFLSERHVKLSVRLYDWQNKTFPNVIGNFDSISRATCLQTGDICFMKTAVQANIVNFTTTHGIQQLVEVRWGDHRRISRNTISGPEVDPPRKSRYLNKKSRLSID